MGGWLARTVTRSSDLGRVLALPRRTLTEADAEALVDEVTDVFITPLGRREGARLKPWQAAAIVEIANNRGAYLGMGVGCGKTLVFLLAALVLEAKRPVLCTLAGLVKQTRDDWARYARHWRIPSPPPRIITYEELTNEPKVDLLDRISPDYLGCDEADVLRNPGSSMTKRIDRYRIAHWDDCTVVCGTGTPGRLSLLDLWHQLIWALRDNAPVPLNNSEAETWAAAIDEKASRFGQRPGVGALRELGGEGATLIDRARDGFRKRLVETPGVVIVDKDSCDQPLHIRQVLVPIDPVLEKHFEPFRAFKLTPGGEKLGDPLSVYRHANELGSGFYSYFDPPPPEPWVEARRTKNSFVYDTIEASADSKRPLDTEAAVVKAFPNAWQILAWREVSELYDPAKHTKVAWLSDSVVEFALDYIDEAEAAGEPVLCWSWQIPFCEALEYASFERAKARGTMPTLWYGRKGMTRSGRFIGQADGKASAILSGGANLRGRNLQKFKRSVFFSPPMSARALEQAFGRNHRGGQDSPVHIDWVCTSGESFDGLERAEAEARFGKQTWAVSQKLLHAEIIKLSDEEWPRGTNRFARKSRPNP